jgi:hypothetical protein
VNKITKNALSPPSNFHFNENWVIAYLIIDGQLDNTESGKRNRERERKRNPERKRKREMVVKYVDPLPST